MEAVYRIASVATFAATKREGLLPLPLLIQTVVANSAGTFALTIRRQPINLIADTLTRELVPPYVKFLALVLLLPQCAVAMPRQSVVGTSPAKDSIAPVTITDQDNGKDIDMSAGGSLVVKLRSSPSTGYSWIVAGEPSPLRLAKSTYQKSSKSTHMVGSAGTQVLQFSAATAGMATLNLVYRRTWEYNEPPARKFSVRVNVR